MSTFLDEYEKAFKGMTFNEVMFQVVKKNKKEKAERINKEAAKVLLMNELSEKKQKQWEIIDREIIRITKAIDNTLYLLARNPKNPDELLRKLEMFKSGRESKYEKLRAITQHL
jgi:hypothetical protein